ncbi:unnamed protein product [Spirodela intermedia]|uniref:Nudix hydrolase domain-containing protein n=1 Tax=Spirodela intermedia TaxID=51605 RepID=A0A7I8KDB5_SPIIN|nr:unnamed protein product [Spirodela intermedia]
MVALVARRGRDLQRYNDQGHRLVVGCIPYRLKVDNPRRDEIGQALQVLIISSQKGHDIMFPKGGWESDETIEGAASREAVEEAGVKGHIEGQLGMWVFKSKTKDSCKEGYMFPMRVTTELHVQKSCKQQWMKEALDKLVEQLLARSSR